MDEKRGIHSPGNPMGHVRVEYIPNIPEPQRCDTCGSYAVPGLMITINRRWAVVCQNCTNFLYYGHDNPRPEVWSDHYVDPTTLNWTAAAQLLGRAKTMAARDLRDKYHAGERTHELFRHIMSLE